MTHGIFHVDFRASTGDYGDGLVVVKDGAVNGGDPHYLYQGTVPNISGAFQSQFKVTKWRDGNTNVLGIDNYILDAKGFVDYEKGLLELQGSVVGAPNLTIQLKGKKIKDAI
ncbi:GrlR family regulatory protein [Pseudomonas parakoreensis]